MERYDTYAPIAALSDIDENHMQLLRDRARELICRDSVVDFSSADVSELTLVGECLLLAKTLGGDVRYHNRLVVVYQGMVSSRYFDRFWCISR